MPDRPALIVDCDPGHDDALALVLADAYADVLGITSVSGNAPLDDTTRNASVSRRFWGSSADVYAGEAGPLVGDPATRGVAWQRRPWSGRPPATRSRDF
ncbi:MAG: hypothetical protein CM1200mP9_05460 [Gammaproteobacteria bacterium]|nr:MAG: hypothetical protein CM1200mP9_05460 [Gammaproteobacteria bacterium]